MISLAHLTAVDANPVQLIHMAAEAGYDAVGLRLTKVTEDSPGYPLMSDHKLLKDTQQALQQTDIQVNDIEFIKVTPDLEANSLIRLLDTGQILGARKLITAPYDNDLQRLSDKLAQIAQLAEQREIQTVLEFFPWTSVPDYRTAHQVVLQAGNGVGILLDSLHFDRSPSSLADLDILGTELISMIHLCDAPVLASYTTTELLYCAREARLPPGQGQIDLYSLLAKMPAGLPVGLEVPMAPSGQLTLEQMYQIARESIAGARHVLHECGYFGIYNSH